jgi:hypothetical protein
MSFEDVLSNTSAFSGALPVIAVILNYKRLDKVLRIAAVFFVISAGFDLWQAITIKMLMVNNLHIIRLFLVICLLFFSAIYYNAFFSRVLKKTVVILSALVLLIMIVNVVFIDAIKDYPALPHTVLNIVLIFYSLAYFYQLLSRQEFVHIEKQGLFWINAGVLFYFSINIFLFMLFSRIIQAGQQDYLMIQSVTNIIANLLYTVGLLCKPQPQQTT